MCWSTYINKWERTLQKSTHTKYTYKLTHITHAHKHTRTRNEYNTQTQER